MSEQIVQLNRAMTKRKHIVLSPENGKKAFALIAYYLKNTAIKYSLKQICEIALSEKYNREIRDKGVEV